jgi:hypothetical protein
MTSAQRIYLMADLWPSACRAQGWNADDRDLRLNVLSEAVQRPLASANDINDRADFDAVKAHLKLLADHVQGAMESGHPEIGRARRLRRKIVELVRCLNLYADGEAYAREVIKDGTHRAGADVTAYDSLPLPRLLESLTATPRFYRSDRTGRLVARPSQLDQVVMTLSRALNGKNGFRAKAGHSIHEMLIRAGLECACRECCLTRFQPPMDGEEQGCEELAEVPF